MAIEYAGYIPTTKQVNWESLTDKFAEKVGTAISARKEERASLDKIAADNEKMINEQELGKNQAVTEFITREGFKGKNFINGLNRELKLGHITPQQYKLAMNNVTENWGTLASTAKTYDEKMQELLNRQQVDPETGKIAGSSFEMEKQKIYQEALDMANNSTQWSQNGNLSLAKTDKDGKIIGDLHDIRSLANPENIFVNRVQVIDEVVAAVENAGGYQTWKETGGGGDLTVEGLYNNPLYKTFKEDIANKICPAGDDTRTLSVMVDNGILKNPATYYQKDEEKQSKIEELVATLAETKQSAGLDKVTAAEEAKIRADLEKENNKKKKNKKLTADQITVKVIERSKILETQKANLVNVTDAERKDIEMSMIKLEKDSYGVVKPVLTEAQKRYAKDGVKNTIDVHADNKISGTAKATYAPVSRPSGESGKKVVGFSTYKRVVDAIASNNPASLNAMSLGKRQYEIMPNGHLNIFLPQGAWYQGEKLASKFEIAHDVSNLSVLAPDFVEGTDSNSVWDQEEINYNQKFGSVVGKQEYNGLDPDGNIITRTRK